MYNNILILVNTLKGDASLMYFKYGIKIFENSYGKNIQDILVSYQIINYYMRCDSHSR